MISILILPMLISSGNLKAAVVIDHTSVQNFDSIPDELINHAKSNLRIAYGRTSHGSQILTGMELLRSENESLYGYTTGSEGFLCSDGPYSCITGALDLGNPDRTAWATATRAYLNGSGSNRNVIMWSWCGQVTPASEYDIAVSYLANMEQLEQEFPDVTFIYMTGHLDGTGEDGNLKIRNQQIRDYVINNNKVLFDFADIESYDPDGTYYPDEDDACIWCYDWCQENTCCDSPCEHSHCFNCYIKGKAFWYMAAVLAGWDESDVNDSSGDSQAGASSDDSSNDKKDSDGGGCFISTSTRQ